MTTDRKSEGSKGSTDTDWAARTTLRNWRRDTKNLAEAHSESRVYYRRISHLLTIISLVMGACTSSAAVFTGGNSLADNDNIDGRWNVVMGCMGIASTVSVAMNTMFTPGTIANAHRECEKTYNKLTREITAQLVSDLSPDSDHRVFSSLGKCVIYFREKLDEVEDQAPPIPASVRKHAAYVVGTSANTRRNNASISDDGLNPPSSVLASPSGRLAIPLETFAAPWVSSRVAGSLDMKRDSTLVINPRFKPTSP